MNAFEFHCPTRIICGEHALHKLPVILVEMGVTKPLVVTDANLVALGITDHAIHRHSHYRRHGQRSYARCGYR